MASPYNLNNFVFENSVDGVNLNLQPNYEL